MSQPACLPKRMLVCDVINTQPNKLKTSGNDPTITQSMRYSKLVNARNYVITTPPPNKIYSYKTPLFTRTHL
jgi:hypothetical protein